MSLPILSPLNHSCPPPTTTIVSHFPTFFPELFFFKPPFLLQIFNYCFSVIKKKKKNARKPTHFLNQFYFTSFYISQINFIFFFVKFSVSPSNETFSKKNRNQKLTTIFPPIILSKELNSKCSILIYFIVK